MAAVTNPLYEKLLKSPLLRINTNLVSDVGPSDSTLASAILERIASERSWTRDQIDNDLTILKCNRLFTVQDLRALSDHSWMVIDLLPLVKDLLRAAIDPSKRMQRQNSLDQYKKKKDKKKDRSHSEPVEPIRKADDEENVSLDPAIIASTIQSMRMDYISGPDLNSPSNSACYATSPRKLQPSYPTTLAQDRPSKGDRSPETEQKMRWRRGTVFIESPTESPEDLIFDIRTTTGMEA